MSFTRLRYHFVTATKERQALITPEVEPVLYEHMRDVVEETDGEVVEIGGIEDHVHLIAAIHPTVAPSNFMRRVKSESSRRLSNSEAEFHRFEWQTGFAGFTLSPFDLEPVREYVRNQKEHHERERVWRRFELMKEIRAA